jgi:hypothetical protein
MKVVVLIYNSLQVAKLKKIKLNINNHMFVF